MVIYAKQDIELGDEITYGMFSTTSRIQFSYCVPLQITAFLSNKTRSPVFVVLPNVVAFSTRLSIYIYFLSKLLDRSNYTFALTYTAHMYILNIRERKCTVIPTPPLPVGLHRRLSHCLDRIWSLTLSTYTTKMDYKALSAKGTNKYGIII